jgi:hypothetical protein
MIEYVIKKGSNFVGIPYSILEFGKERWSGSKDRSFYETEEYDILSQTEFEKKVEVFCETLCGNWKEITEQKYDEMLDNLRPLEWERGGFFISEGYTLDIHLFYQKWRGRYYEAYFRITTPRDEILKSLREFIISQENKI